MPWNEDQFRKRLNELMDAQQKNQRETGELIGLSAGAVSRWTKPGDNLPDLRKLAALAEKFNVSPAWLAFGDQFTPMNESEKEVIELLRAFTPQAQAGFVAMLSSIHEPRKLSSALLNAIALAAQAPVEARLAHAQRWQAYRAACACAAARARRIFRATRSADGTPKYSS